MSKELIQFINSFATPIRILDVDVDQRPVYSVFNKAALKDVNLCHEDIVGRTALDLYPGVLGEIANNRHRVVIESCQPLVFDMDEDSTNGRQSIRITLAPMIDENGKVARIFCTQVDVTAEKLMQSIESDAETRVREMEQYIALAAHDLRTPMRNVRLIAEFMKEDFAELGSDKLHLISKLEDMSTSAMSLISEVLSHAQATSKRDSEVSIFQLSELGSEIMAVLDPLSRNTLICNDSSVATDKVAVQIAISNLIDNALKHNNSEGVQLSVFVNQKSTEFIEIQVADDGKGFSESSMEFISTREFGFDGCFGLMGVSRMIRNRGGDLRVAPKETGGGAVISFTLPGTLLDLPATAVSPKSE